MSKSVAWWQQSNAKNSTQLIYVTHRHTDAQTNTYTSVSKTFVEYKCILNKSTFACAFVRNLNTSMCLYVCSSVQLNVWYTALIRSVSLYHKTRTHNSIIRAPFQFPYMLSAKRTAKLPYNYYLSIYIMANTHAHMHTFRYFWFKLM